MYILMYIFYREMRYFSNVGMHIYNAFYTKKCATLPMWKEFDGIVHDYFYGKKLSDFL